MSYKYDYAVFIGRFQPFHIGHYQVAQEALRLSENLIFVIGSHDKPRDFRNPFTTPERINIIKSTGLPEDRIHFAPQTDHMYNDEKWIASIQASVQTIIHRKFVPGPIKICIIGFDKDHSSYYLKKFPQWDLVQIEPKHKIDATTIREALIIKDTCNSFDVKLESWRLILETFTPIRTRLLEEYEYIKRYKEEWGKGPFVTVDAVVTQAGHILLIERGKEYGEGQWALPGGFVGPDETLLEATLRELREETKLKVPKPVLVGSIAKEHTYDNPHRSNRSRIISHAYHFRLNDMDDGLPKVKGSDDAQKAWWCPLSEFAGSRHKMFEDHFDIIEHMLGL